MITLKTLIVFYRIWSKFNNNRQILFCDCEYKTIDNLILNNRVYRRWCAVVI
jgi:hypothetical protein